MERADGPTAAVDDTRDLDASAVALECSTDGGTCAFHQAYKPVCEEISRYLTSTTVADLASARARTPASRHRASRRLHLVAARVEQRRRTT